MTDTEEAARLALDSHIPDLAAQHQLLMHQLYDAILTENDLPPLLDDVSRLVAEQYDVAKQLKEAEAEMIAKY